MLEMKCYWDLILEGYFYDMFGDNGFILYMMDNSKGKNEKVESWV